jgi:hypothetical protein
MASFSTPQMQHDGVTLITTSHGLTNIAARSLFTITRYEGMAINGYTFYTMTQDKKSVYQNSGVRVWAVVDDSHDDDDDMETDT